MLLYLTMWLATVQQSLLIISSPQNGLSVDSLLVCVEPMTFDKVRLIQWLGELEPELLQQAQNILRRYLSLNAG
jgi:mRNA interferase MazF